MCVCDNERIVAECAPLYFIAVAANLERHFPISLSDRFLLLLLFPRDWSGVEQMSRVELFKYVNTLKELKENARNV